MLLILNQPVVDVTAAGNCTISSLTLISFFIFKVKFEFVFLPKNIYNVCYLNIPIIRIYVFIVIFILKIYDI